MPYKNHISAIYKITCVENNKIYIGSSLHAMNRIAQHKGWLRKNKHFNIYLQNAWNKYGESKFIFEIIEEVASDIILFKEKEWIDKLNSIIPNGFNISKDTTAPMTGRKHSDEAKEKFKLRTGDKNGMYGRKHTKEAINKMSTATKQTMNEERKKELSMLASQRIGDKNPFFGRKHSDELKKKLSKSRQILTKEQATEAKKMVQEYKLTYKQVAEHFKVSTNVIGCIVRGTTYKD